MAERHLGLITMLRRGVRSTMHAVESCIQDFDVQRVLDISMEISDAVFPAR